MRRDVNLFAVRLYEMELQAWSQGVSEDEPPRPWTDIGLTPEQIDNYLERMKKLRPPLEMRTSFAARVLREHRKERSEPMQTAAQVVDGWDRKITAICQRHDLDQNVKAEILHFAYDVYAEGTRDMKEQVQNLLNGVRGLENAPS